MFAQGWQYSRKKRFFFLERGYLGNYLELEKKIGYLAIRTHRDLFISGVFVIRNPIFGYSFWGGRICQDNFRVQILKFSIFAIQFHYFLILYHAQSVFYDHSVSYKTDQNDYNGYWVCTQYNFSRFSDQV